MYPPFSDAGATGRPAEFDIATGFDALDNDENHVTDCAETSCQVVSGACCVGRGTAACCALPAGALPLDFTGCTGDPSACLGGARGVAFASSADGNALVLTGDGSSDSGLWRPRPRARRP